MTKPRIVLLSLLVLFAAGGYVGANLVSRGEPEATIGAILAFPTAILLYLWCKTDARNRGIEVPPGASLLVGMLSPIGVPYYYFRILSVRNALLHLIFAACYLEFLNVSVTLGWNLAVHVLGG